MRLRLVAALAWYCGCASARLRACVAPPPPVLRGPTAGGAGEGRRGADAARLGLGHLRRRRALRGRPRHRAKARGSTSPPGPRRRRSSSSASRPERSSNLEPSSSRRHWPTSWATSSSGTSRRARERPSGGRPGRRRIERTAEDALRANRASDRDEEFAADRYAVELLDRLPGSPGHGCADMLLLLERLDLEQLTPGWANWLSTHPTPASPAPDAPGGVRQEAVTLARLGDDKHSTVRRVRSARLRRPAADQRRPAPRRLQGRACAQAPGRRARRPRRGHAAELPRGDAELRRHPPSGRGHRARDLPAGRGRGRPHPGRLGGQGRHHVVRHGLEGGEADRRAADPPPRAPGRRGRQGGAAIVRGGDRARERPASSRCRAPRATWPSSSTRPARLARPRAWRSPTTTSSPTRAPRRLSSSSTASGGVSASCPCRIPTA